MERDEASRTAESYKYQHGILQEELIELRGKYLSVAESVEHDKGSLQTELESRTAQIEVLRE